MATPVVYMKSVERVGNVYETLQVAIGNMACSIALLFKLYLFNVQTTTHNFFPVIGKFSTHTTHDPSLRVLSM